MSPFERLRGHHGAVVLAAVSLSFFLSAALWARRMPSTGLAASWRGPGSTGRVQAHCALRSLPPGVDGVAIESAVTFPAELRAEDIPVEARWSYFGQQLCGGHDAFRTLLHLKND